MINPTFFRDCGLHFPPCLIGSITFLFCCIFSRPDISTSLHAFITLHPCHTPCSPSRRFHTLLIDLITVLNAAHKTCSTNTHAAVYPNDVSKTDAARITKRDKEMFHHKSWKPIYSASKGHRSRSHSAGVGHCTLVSAGFF